MPRHHGHRNGHVNVSKTEFPLCLNHEMDPVKYIARYKLETD